MKPLLIGPAPGPHQAFSGTGSGRKLCRLLDIEAVQKYFDALNLLAEWPGRAPSGGDAFPLPLARSSALSVDASGRPFVLLVGRNVARAFRLDWLRYCEWSHLWYPETGEPLCGVPVAVIPHPSGHNRAYNDLAQRDRTRSFVREALGL